jgi:uncharacterized protein YecE (DUF72 family)
MTAHAGQPGYRLGLPAWAFAGWRGRYFDNRPTSLASYARVFNTVEGNTSFYRVPDSDSLRRWRESLAGRDFKLCFKLPREVTHETRCDRAALRQFLSAVEALREWLGPLLVQLPARVGPASLEEIARLLEALPADWPAVLEVRHPQFFARPEILAPLLTRFSIGRVMLDSRPLYRGDRAHPEVRAALHEKPDLPVLDQVYNGVAFVRLVLHPDLDSNGEYLQFWARRVAHWLARGDEVFMMIHCPNNLHCPPLAERFHQLLRAGNPGLGLAPLPGWPIPQQPSLI